MNKSATLRFIVERQRRWAGSQHLAVTANGRLARLEDNLFAPLNIETRAEFEAGDGDEFGTDKTPGKMHSIHSSSALVCNVFDFWRKHPIGPLLQACGVEDSRGGLKFEQKFATGVSTKCANLDVLIMRSGECLPVAIESKFTEPFQTNERDCLRPAYFRKPKIWDELPICKRIAESLTAKKRFKCFKAAQLLKHALALSRKFGRKQFVLLYLWYDVPASDAAKQHGSEVQEFGDSLGDDVLFRSDTYQNVFDRLSPLMRDAPYAKYLRSRYFG
jgi:hypothetical protein